MAVTKRCESDLLALPPTRRPRPRHATTAAVLFVLFATAALAFQGGRSGGTGAVVAMGYATCGQVGFEGRFEYTAIGTVTNLAARLCSQAKGGQVLVSQRVFSLVESRVNAELVGELEYKGLSRPMPTYSLTGLRT